MKISVAELSILITSTAIVFALLGAIVQARRSIQSSMLIPQRVPPATARSAAARWMSFIDGIAAGVIISDRAGNLVHWNPAALRLHGYSSLDEVRSRLEDFKQIFTLSDVHGGVLPFEEWPLPKAIRGESVSDYEVELRRTDTGESWTIRYSCAAVRVLADEDEQIVLTLQDLTPQRRAERDLRQNEAHLRDLIESLPQPVWTCRPDGECDYLSPQFLQYTNVPLSEQVGFGWLNQIHPDDRANLKAEWQRVRSEGISFATEFRIRRADGDYRWFKSRALPLRDAAGQVTKWIGTSTDIHEERTALESRALLAAIVEYSQDPIIAKSLDGRITSWNAAAERVFGYSSEEAIGRNVKMLLPPDQLHEEEDILASIRAGRPISYFESKRITKDGRLLDVALTISPVCDASGRVVGASKIVRDITSFKRAEGALRESEARFRHVAAAMPQIVWTARPDGHVTYLNERWSQFTGLVSATAEDRLALVHPDDLAAVRARAAQGRASGTPYSIEFRMHPTSGGDYRWFLARAVPMRDADGNIVEWFGTSTDIDDLKRTESLLRDRESRLAASEKHLRGVLNSLLVYVGVFTPTGQLSWLNRAAYEMATSRGLLAKQWELPPTGDNGCADGKALPGMSEGSLVVLRNAMTRAAGGEDVRLDAVALFDDEPRIAVDLMFAPLRDDDGQVSHLIVSAVDVTERELQSQRARDRQMELAHLERLRTMGQMAAGLAHELNQPLGAITNYASACQRLLSSDRAPTARLAEALKDIQSEALRSGAIVQRLRSFVKKQEPQVIEVDPNSVVQETAQILAFELRQAEVELQFQLAENLPAVLVDPIQIGQVVINLVRNSLDAMADVEPSHRALIIETSYDEMNGQVRVAVRDRGCGVSQQDLSRLFDAFFTTKPDGLGIGLSLCRTIIEDHGGHLAAAPNAAGGMTLTFTIQPAAERATQRGH